MTDEEKQQLKDAEDAVFNCQTELEELYAKRTETIRLAGMLVRSTGGLEEIAWVDVFAREILAVNKVPGDS